MTNQVHEYDQICQYHGGLIQYGKFNDRIYLMKMPAHEALAIIPELDNLAREEGLGKVFAKVPAKWVHPFVLAGYAREAYIPHFFKGEEDGAFLGKYFDDSRRNPPNAQELENIQKLAEQQSGKSNERSLPDNMKLCYCREDDAAEMAEIYGQVFPTYPFPIQDPEYIIQTMHSNVLYFSVRLNDKIIALSSAEIDRNAANAEMTDFATLPEFRGHSLATLLLQRMEYDMAKLKLNTLYTIARAISPGMNITFARCGYQFGGRLINNTNISGNLESMNVWYKNLHHSE